MSRGRAYRDDDDLALDTTDYWDDTIPAPHHFSSSGSPYPSSPSRTSVQSDPFRNPPQANYTQRGAYTPVAPVELPAMRSYADRDRSYAAVNENTSPWLEKTGNKSRSRLFLWGGIGLAAVLIIAGIVAGVVASKHKSSNSSSSPSKGNSADPSKFTKDSALKNSFYGFAYTPLGAILPDCGATQEGVIEDIQLLSQLTTRIRTYGSDCNVSSFILSAIKDTKVDMTVYLGLFIDNADDSVYQRQKQLTQTAMKDFGSDHVAGLTVGNEFILQNVTAAQSTDPNSAAGLAAADFLKTKVADVRQMLSDMSITNIPVGTADAGGYFNTDILEAVDYAMANIHPWFASVTIDQSAAWTGNFFQTEDVDLAKNTTKNPTFTIAETGWPTNSSTTVDAANGAGAAASIANLQTYLDTFVCQANANNTGYFFFEFMDEPWKLAKYPGVEGYWGLFDSNKKLKNVTIPECSHP